MVTASGVAGEGGRWGPDAEDAAISCHITMPKSLASGGDPNRRTPGPAPIPGRAPASAPTLAAAPSRRHPHRHAQRGDPLVPHREHQDRGPRPRGGRAPPAAASVCPRRSHGTAQLFSGEATGLIVRLPDWALSRRHRHDDRAGPLRQLQRRLGRPGAARPLPPDLRRREGTHRGPQEGPPGHRAGPGRRLHQADHHASEVAREDHRDHRRPQGPEQGRDPRLHRRRVPRGQPVRRAGPRAPIRPRRSPPSSTRARPSPIRNSTASPR